MTIHRDEIESTVKEYLGRYPDEVGRLQPLLTALDSDGELTSRKTVPGHVTCSAFLIAPDGRVLHIRHNSLDRWLQPGGHVEPVDANLVAAAAREVAEETGITADQLALVGDGPVDIDVHLIPPNPAKSEPGHHHYDIRYAFRVAASLPVTMQLEEVNDFAWLPVEAVDPELTRAKIAATR